jgi:hypothetical protein
MGKVSNALQYALNRHNLTPAQLADALQVQTPIVTRWFNGQLDPTAETTTNIITTLRTLHPAAADDFVRVFLDVAPILTTPATPTDFRTLPPSGYVNIAALAQLFKQTTNSYKFLFFISLLDILRRRNFDTTQPITFYELIVEMLANAWYPHAFFRLSLGAQDKIADTLDGLNLTITEPILKFTDVDKKHLRDAISSQDLREVLGLLRRYVPFRLIIPFLEEELKLRGVDRGKGNRLDVAMPAIANEFFEARKPLYRFDSDSYNDCSAIMIHPDWAQYLEQHYPIVRGWVSWEWMQYMQRRNPNTPGLVSKLFPPQKRDSLQRQMKYWHTVLQVKPLRCIYTGSLLTTEDDLSLDHYLPWSFVAHDQLWNLIPASRSVNSSKSNNIPSEQYFERFVTMQYEGIVTSKQVLTEQRWKNFLESHMNDLKLTPDALLDKNQLHRAYELNVNSQVALAASQGFSTNWVYLPRQT